ncbi:hypothetical protein F4776DRAFT_655437 [Hypoxylon sp. NC0597]|nr:hypothetical protein F4776DRAFT_655437 [Hypoxylon sp. NC0597]
MSESKVASQRPILSTDIIQSTLNMAELSRAAQVAVRSTSLLRTSASIWPSFSFSIAPVTSIPHIRQISAITTVRPIGASDRRPHTSQTQHRHYASGGWPNPSRESRPSPLDDIDIKKPDISIYDDPFTPEIDFQTGELDRSKILEERPAPTRPPLRLVPRTGRTVHVTRTTDVARSFKLLSIQTSQNRVSADFQLQRFHERPGLKRKRLKSQRWQKRFKKGFKACVSRVKELTKQGW